jgi:hypothetical protein
MAQPTIDPTFYRTAAEAAAAPGEQLAYVVAFDRAAQKNDAMTARTHSLLPQTDSERVPVQGVEGTNAAAPVFCAEPPHVRLGRGSES